MDTIKEKIFNNKERAYLKNNSACCVCGRKSEKIHYIVSPDKGGKFDKNNVMALCGICYAQINENKERLEEAKASEDIVVADRGCVYEFIEKSGEIKNYVLVVSNQSRCKDNIISTIMLNSHSNSYYNIPIYVKDEVFYINCGMVTFAKRERLRNKVAELSEDDMQKVDEALAVNLGLEKLVKYKTMYEVLSRHVKATL